MIHVEYTKVYIIGLAARAKEVAFEVLIKVKRFFLKNKMYQAEKDLWRFESANDKCWLVAIPNLQNNPEVTMVAQVGALEDDSDGVLLFKGSSKPSLQATTTSHGIRFTEKSDLANNKITSKTWTMSYQQVLDVLVCAKFLMANKGLEAGEWFTNRELMHKPKARSSKAPSPAKKRRKKTAKPAAKKQRKRSK